MIRRRGLLIVLEGLDRSGKSTQARLLVEALIAKSIPAEKWSYPNRNTSIGKLINSYLSRQIELDDHAVHLLFSANRWETVAEMREKLSAGTTLVIDRYAYSGVAYTAAKTGFDFEWCKQCDTGLPKPDLVCFLDSLHVNVESREAYGEERYESTEFQKLVYANFDKLFNLRAGSTDDCLVLNAKESIANLHQTILSTVLEAAKDNSYICDVDEIHEKEDTVFNRTRELGTLW
jgi:dTMP kinase